jgi:periplasmic divalent cation tolerance protein
VIRGEEKTVIRPSELVDARLIACANVLDASVTSTYRWQGAVEVEPEKRMHVHTRLDLADQVTEFVQDRHPYDVPNVTAIPLVAGNPDYFVWIDDETRDADARVDRK